MSSYRSIISQVLHLEAESIIEAEKRLNEESLEQLAILFKELSKNAGNLIISGVGKSGLIGAKIAATFSSLGLPSFFLHPTEAMHGDLGRVTKNDAIVLISKSGTTEELLAMLPYVSIPKNRVIALVGNINSPISKVAGIVMDASVKKEACLNDLAPTTSTTLALALGDAMAILFEKVADVSREKFLVYHPAGLLGKSLSLKVERLMVKESDCPKISYEASLQEAILAMTKFPVGMCAIIGNDELKGILLEGDIRRAFTKREDALKLPVKDFMTLNPITVTSETLAVEALKLMENPKRLVNVIPVVNGKSFQGVLRLHDIFKAGFTSTI